MAGKRPRLTLCAAITFDGKLDHAELLPPALLRALAPGAGTVILLENEWARELPPGWAHPTRLIGPADLADLRQTLKPSPAETMVRRWLCLGGPNLFRALLEARLVDDLCLRVRPQIDGRRGAATLSGPLAPEFFPASISCRLRHMEIDESECLLHYTVTRSKGR